MIPNIKTGKSFRGAQLYYLHDKRGEGEALRLSDERVAWTETRNTAHDSPDLAFAEMIATAEHQDQLKIMTGVRLSGRPCEEPVMTISLSWHPSETPSRDTMAAAADGYLQAMGWDEHQAIYVAHNDTPHAHLHIILSRIHPETGKVLDDAFSKIRSQEWAREYEREHGRIWCDERVGKDYSRAGTRGGAGSMPYDFAHEAYEAERRYAELEEGALAFERGMLGEHHKQEREAFFDTRHQQFREARQSAFHEVREEYKPRWVQHFRWAKDRRRDAEIDAAGFAREALACARRGDFAGAWEAAEERKSCKQDVEIEIAEERAELRAQQRFETRQRQDATYEQVYDERANAFVIIKERQKQERAEFGNLQDARRHDEPYDQNHYFDLVNEPAAERIARAAKDHPSEPVAEALKPSTELIQQRLAERDGEAGCGGARSDPVSDIGERAAGGIGKAAEALANALASIISPPTPREQAAERALDDARQEAEAERQPAREEAEAQRRYVHIEQQRAATDPFEGYFNENAERIRREWEERRRKAEDRDRGR